NEAINIHNNMTSNITQQEIKYAVREITSKPDEKLIKRVQDYFEFYPETLEQLTDEKFKETFIKLLYNYGYLHSELMTSTIETEATGRIILEVLMKENGLNQEEINELLDRNC
ncbi:7253_t:CDS:1, partial [Paraglomus brasilianum]